MRLDKAAAALFGSIMFMLIIMSCDTESTPAQKEEDVAVIIKFSSNYFIPTILVFRSLIN